MDSVILITTYNRRESCQRLVDSLQGQGDIIVLGDCVDYIITGCTFFNQKYHMGMKNYWITVKELWTMRGFHKYYFMLPDDFLPTENIVAKAIATWDTITDPRKICLNLYADRIGRKCWTQILPVDRGSVWQTGWVDMCFMAEEQFFKVVRLRNSQIGNSSGVGAQISRSLVKNKYSLFQVKESLVYPTIDHTVTQMHSNENQKNTWDSKYSRKKRTFDTRTQKRNRPGR